MNNPGVSGGERPATRHVRFKEILLVEEDETWALALKDALSEGGFRVNLALSPSEAVRSLRRKSPDLVAVSALLGDEASELLLHELECLKLPPPVLLVGPRAGEKRWENWKALPVLSSVGQPFDLADVRQAARAILGSAWEDLMDGTGPDREGASP
jgi:DNA-binding response OmpR family regulator